MQFPISSASAKIPISSIPQQDPFQFKQQNTHHIRNLQSDHEQNTTTTNNKIINKRFLWIGGS